MEKGEDERVGKEKAKKSKKMEDESSGKVNYKRKNVLFNWNKLKA